MQIIANFNEFKKSLEKVERLNTSNSSLPIIENLHLKSKDGILTLTKTNLNTQIQAKVFASTEEGELLIPASTIKIIKNMKNGNDITITNECLMVDKKVVKFKQLEINNYPKIKVNADIKKFEVGQQELLRLLTCKYAVAQDEARPILTGVNINNNEFVALNGFYLSKRHSEEFTSDLNVVINSDMIKMLDKVLDKKSSNKVEVYVNEKETDNNNIIREYIRFDFDNISIEGRLLDGEPMKYKSIIPDSSNSKTTLKINDENLQEKLKIFKSLNSDKPLDKIVIENDKVIISSSDMENIIEDEIKCDIEGDDLTIAFNNQYLIETTKQYSDFKMYLINSVSPAVITNDGKNLELVLPVRLIR